VDKRRTSDFRGVDSNIDQTTSMSKGARSASVDQRRAALKGPCRWSRTPSMGVQQNERPPVADPQSPLGGRCELAQHPGPLGVFSEPAEGALDPSTDLRVQAMQVALGCPGKLDAPSRVAHSASRSASSSDTVWPVPLERALLPKAHASSGHLVAATAAHRLPSARMMFLASRCYGRASVVRSVVSSSLMALAMSLVSGKAMGCCSPYLMTEWPA
jgi:hypothetical protein